MLIPTHTVYIARAVLVEDSDRNSVVFDNINANVQQEFGIV